MNISYREIEKVQKLNHNIYKIEATMLFLFVIYGCIESYLKLNTIIDILTLK